MLELGMIASLALMGVYFFKSTDLPKELTERSAQLNSEIGKIQATQTKKMTFPKVQVNQDLDEKLVLIKEQKRLKEIAIHQNEIDRLTLEITTLEQQIRANNSKNAEIQKTIEAHLITLSNLQEKIAILG